MPYTPKQVQACRTALVIDDPGASNASGVALGLHEIICAWKESGDSVAAARCPPALLAMNQLCHLMGLDGLSLDEYHDVKEKCKKIAEI